MSQYTDDYEDEIKTTPLDTIINEDKQTTKLAKQAQVMMIKNAMVTAKPNHSAQEVDESVDIMKAVF